MHVEPTNPCLVRPTLVANPLIPDTPQTLNHQTRVPQAMDGKERDTQTSTCTAPGTPPQGEEGGLAAEAGRNLHVEPTNPCLMRPTLAANPLMPDMPRPLNQQPRITLDPLGRAKDRATTRSRIAEYLQPERKLYAPQHDHSHNPPKPHQTQQTPQTHPHTCKGMELEKVPGN